MGSLTALAAALALATELSAPSAPSPPGSWTVLEAGLDWGEFEAPKRSALGDSRIRVLRIDPGRFELRLLNASAGGGTRSARRWCEERDLVAAINASMYQEDHRTSVSLMRSRDHVNNGRLSKDRTVLAFDPLEPGIPPVTLIDRECDDLDSLRARYGTLVQSIRMVSCRRENCWSPQPRQWSTAAVGLDGTGRILFIHVRSPYVVHDLIEMLLRLPIDLARCMYVEGGPEAQLFVRAGGEAREHVGSFETGFFPGDDNAAAWPVPNVLGVVRRETR